MSWNKTIHITERSKVSAFMLMLFFPTPSQIQGDYFLRSLKGPFHTTTRREVSKGECSMGPAEEQCKPLAWPRHSIPQVQKARTHAPVRITWDRLWRKLTQTEHICFQNCLRLGSVEEGVWPRRTELLSIKSHIPAGPRQQPAEDASRLGGIHKSTGLKQWKTT